MPITLSGTGVAAPAPLIGELSMPGSVAMLDQRVGTASASSTVTVSNVGNAAVTITSIASSNAAEFPIGSSTCTTVNAGGLCTFGITFQPSAAGRRSSTVTVASDGIGNPQSIAVSGTGNGAVATARAIEYYHQSFDHYFITAIADEITKLDNGTFAGGSAPASNSTSTPRPPRG